MSPKKLVKPTVHRPGIKSLLTIRKFQKLDKLIIKEVPFYRLIDKLLMDIFLKKGREATWWQAKAIEHLQWAIKNIFSVLFSGAVEAMVHAEPVTFMSRDLHLAIRMRGYD